MTATCKNCRHSTPDVEYTSWEKSGYLVCQQPKWIKGYAIDKDQLPADGVHVEDDEDWAFRVGPDFGCIHWAPRSEGELGGKGGDAGRALGASSQP